MNQLLKEIDEIPAMAREFLKASSDFQLPLDVPYIGMGSSYFAPLAFKYMGIDIHPEIASEYYNYVFDKEKHEIAVILSQSGESSESLWCRELFGNYIAITNNWKSSLAVHPNAKRTVLLHAGEEKYSSTKTYINTLLALFKGFGFDPSEAVELLSEKIVSYKQLGEKLADEIFRKITDANIHGIYVTGSGPNLATAYEASLILSENTRLCFTGLPMAQYDHGPKETSEGSIVIQILAKGKSRDRSVMLADKIARAGAHVITIEEPDAEENFSIIHNTIPFNYLAVYLADKLGITETFTVGGKITTVS